MTKTVLISIAIFISLSTAAQTTITLQPGAEGKDATVWNLFPSNNYGNHVDFVALTRTRQGEVTTFRSFIDFDFTAIPAGATIIHAKLSLYHNADSPDVGHEGMNNAYLRRITEDWNETTVTWNNQPSSTAYHQIILDESQSETQHYEDIDVTQLVRDMVDQPQSKFGFSIQLVTEEIYRSMKFASGDAENADLHPKLDITYSADCLVLQPGNEGKDATIWNLMPDNNYAHHQDFVALTRTRQGEVTTFRSFIEFDLTAASSSQDLISAYLALYHNPTSPDVGHEGDNESYLRRVTEPWEEDGITWNAPPATTEAGKILLPTSTLPDEDYTLIDVTEHIRDMIEYPENNFGFELKLDTEEIYRSMKFASSDYSNADLRPRLELCFASPVSTKQLPFESISIDPNPFHESFYITLPTDRYRIVLIDPAGRTIGTAHMDSSGQAFRIDAFAQVPVGSYTILFYGTKSVYYARVIKTG